MSKSGQRTVCPTCGRRQMARVVRSISTRMGQKQLAVRGVSVEECAHCGERLYDLTALRKIREARDKARSTPAA